jgi:choice-of-anchor C domain-containing protein
MANELLNYDPVFQMPRGVNVMGSYFRGLVTLVAVAALPAFADVTNGQFLNGGNDPFSTYYAGDATSIPGWAVTAGVLDPTQGSVDWIGNYWQAPPPGGHSVDLDGLTPGGISQTLTLAAGSYVLSFYLSGNPDGPPPAKALLVTAGGSSQNFTYTLTPSSSESNMGWTLESLAFTTAGGSTTVAFQSDDLASEGNSLPAYGPVVGGVSLTQVPEAGFYAYAAALGLGLSGFLMLFRRQRQA